MPTLGDLLLGRQSGGLLDLMKQYGAGVKQRVGLLADDPAEFTRQALLDVVPNRAEAQAAQARVMGGSLDPQAYSGYLGKMRGLGSLLAPIAVYHGGANLINKFDPAYLTKNTGANDAAAGFHFAGNKSDAWLYADMAAQKAGKESGDVGRYLVRTNNPLILGVEGNLDNSVRGKLLSKLLKDKLAARRYAEKAGHDAIIYPNGTDVDAGYTLISWQPNNIRLAKKQPY